MPSRLEKTEGFVVAWVEYARALSATPSNLASRGAEKGPSARELMELTETGGPLQTQVDRWAIAMHLAIAEVFGA